MDSDVNPVVNPVYVPIEISEDEVHFRVGPFKGARHTISDGDGEGVIADLVDQLDGTSTVDEIATAFDEPNQARAAMEFLFDKNVLLDASDDDIDDPLRNYSSIASETSTADVEHARDSSVGILARGRIGTTVASDLAEIGLESVSVKTVGPDDPGVPGSDRVNHHEGDVESLVEAVDHVVYATESADFETAKRVNSLSFDHGTPLTTAHVLGMEGIVGPTVLPGRTPCYHCLLRHWKLGAVSGTDEEAIEYFEEYLEGPHDEGLHLPSHRHLVAGVLSKELVAHLLNGHGYLAGRTFDVDFLTMEFETNELLKYPRCSVCGVSRDDHDHDRIVGTEVIDDG